MPMPRRLALRFASLGLGLGLVAACTLPNPDHCLHRAADADAWCAQADSARPYCSPCASEHHGCVAELPLECPTYSPAPSDESSSEGESESSDSDSSESESSASASDSSSADSGSN